MKRKINASIIADSTNSHGNRITTFVLTYPRFIHAELLTHRLFSRNAASSRAIPASKMIKDIEEDPFIPVAFQKAHSGMQGNEYFQHPLVEDFINLWLEARDSVVEKAKLMLEGEALTKQLVNRILEPYQWYTCIVTATEYDNFFELRCPQYAVQVGEEEVLYRSEKDLLVNNPSAKINTEAEGVLWKLKNNRGQGEIHISLLAEAMWDSLRESEPKQLKAGEWHIPFGDKMDHGRLDIMLSSDVAGLHPEDAGRYREEVGLDIMIKIATARCARVSYNNFEGKDDYEADIKLYDRLLEMGHASPLEHCSKAQSEPKWSGNFFGFDQLRKQVGL